ncbi:MAG: CoA transferase [Pseudomonadota bacterium]
MLPPPKHLLNGFRVLDMTHVLAGPSATRVLAEMGAEVIKVELPGGDITRTLPVIKDGRSAYFLQQNRGKKSLCIDLKKDEGKAIIRELLEGSDVFIENFAPGVIGRLGFSWEEVQKINPEIIMCSMSAFGQSGELTALPGYDYIAMAYTGMMSMIGEADGAPYFPMAGIGDVMTGMHAAAGIGFALLHRERGGGGQYLDISLIDAYMSCHELNVELYSATNGEVEPSRCGNHHYAVCPLGIFKARDHWICIIALQPQWAGVCKAIGREDLIEDVRYDTNDKRVGKSAEIIDIIQGWLDSMPSDDAIVEALREYRVPCALVLSIGEAIAQPHLTQRGTVRQVHDTKFGELTLPGMPLKFSAFEHNQPMETAYVGEHNRHVLADVLGYSEEKITTLEDIHVLRSDPST